MNAREWWYPQIVDKTYLTRLRKDYPEDANLSDKELIEYYCQGQKYATTWDHVGDAYAEYEKLADAYLDLLAKQEDYEHSAMRIMAESGPTIEEAGYKLVPLEPSEEMIMAADKTACVNDEFCAGAGKSTSKDDPPCLDCKIHNVAVYKAMINVKP